MDQASGSNTVESTKSSTRSRTRPKWYGTREFMNSNCNQVGDDSDPYGDDSIEDANWHPPKKTCRSTDKVVIDADSSVDELQHYDFNEYIERIDSSKVNEPITATVNGATVHEHMMHRATVDKTTIDSLEPLKECSVVLVDAVSQGHKSQKCDSCHEDKEFMSKLYQNSIEILARISVIEDSLLKYKILNPMKKEVIPNLHEEFQIFMESNDLPLRSLVQTKEFEAKLNDVTFKKDAVSMLQAS